MTEVYEPKRPLRSELAKVFKDQRTLIAFEQLFEAVPSEINVDRQLIDEVLIDAGTAQASANSALSLIDRLRKKVIDVSADYTAKIGNYLIMVDASAGPVVVTLPLALHARGFDVGVSKIDTSSNSVTVQRSGSDLIVGETSQVLLFGGEVFNFGSNGDSWELSA